MKTGVVLASALGAAALAGIVSTTVSAAARADDAPAPKVGAAHFAVGTVAVVPLLDNHYAVPNDGKTFGIGAGPDAVAATLKAAGAPADRISVDFGGLLVKDGTRLILIDTGGGAGLQGGLVDSLKQAGFTPDQVTDVLITHSHFDHVGGLVDAAGHSVFTHATIRMTANEWTFMKANAQEAGITNAIAAQVQAFAPGARISDHVTAVAVDGHTPGHSAYEVDGGSAKLLAVGDSVHSSIVSLAHPEWPMGFDSDQKLGAASRVALLTRLSKAHELVYAPHFPFPGVGTIKAEAQGFSWQPAKQP